MEGLTVMRFILAIVLAVPLACIAETYQVMQFNEDVRIVLSNEPCPVKGFDGKIAVAQRIDHQFWRGCWTNEPHEKLVRIQWVFDEDKRHDPNSFSLFDADRFFTDEIN